MVRSQVLKGARRRVARRVGLRPAIPGAAIAFALALSATLLAASPARAQFAMPGSVSPDILAIPETAPQTRPARRARSAPKPAESPSADVKTAQPTVEDRTLLLNGYQSRLDLERRDGGLVAVKMELVGLATDGSGKSCRIDVTASGPLRATEIARDVGAPRYELPVEGCAMRFAALDGAVVMQAPAAACVFAAQACRVDVAGMWGPTAAAVMRRARDIEKSRSRSEETVRAYYKALMRRASGRDAVKDVAREQAGFTSERDMACRNYDQETQHGFCHARYTEARAAELAARLRADGGQPEAVVRFEKPKPRKEKKPQSAPAPAASGPSTPALF
jgi:hypothetical protein